MPTLTFLAPTAIAIRRNARQRQLNLADIEDIKASIKANGIIEPLVVRSEAGEHILVAGERRLLSALDLGLTVVPVHHFEELSETEAEVLELEENIKRKELHWRDHVRSVGRIHTLYKERDKDWRVEQTCQALSLHQTHLHKLLRVFEALDSPRIANVDNIEAAYNTLQHFAERKAASIVGDILAAGATAFVPKDATTEVVGATASGTVDVTIAAETDLFVFASSVGVANVDTGAQTEAATIVKHTLAASPPPPPVLCANFLEWAKTYSGPKFSVIHCDFPYGNYRGGESKGGLTAADGDAFYDNHEEIYWTLLAGLTENLDRIMSYAAHLIFWFNMNFYTETVLKLRQAGLTVHDHPLIWFKTTGGGGIGVAPGTAATYPRRTYDTALLAVRGKRPLAKAGSNSYVAPTVGNKIHPSQKSESMLRYFLGLVVDETTSVLDPTCGSASALRAAEDLGAKSVLGLELDPTYAAAANTKMYQARALRRAGALVRDDQPT